MSTYTDMQIDYLNETNQLIMELLSESYNIIVSQVDVVIKLKYLLDKPYDLKNCKTSKEKKTMLQTIIRDGEIDLDDVVYSDKIDYDILWDQTVSKIDYQ